MAGLFGVETPSEIRSRLGRSGREQDLQLAQLPAGRGGVALASQLGRGSAQGIGQLLGAPTAPQQAQQKNEAIQASIKSEASARGITREENPIEYLGLTSQVLNEAGETQAAANALKFAGQIDKMSNLEPTALEKNVRQIFNVPKREKLPTEARQFMKRMLSLQSTPSSPTGLIPSATPVNTNARKKAVQDVKGFISPEQPLVIGEDTYESTSDFISPDNRKSFELALARRTQELFNLNKQKGNKALSETEVKNKAFTEMKGHLKSVRNKVFGTDIDIPNTQNIVFDEEAFNSSLQVQELTDAISQEVRSIDDL